jgi:hypothetical protein
MEPDIFFGDSGQTTVHPRTMVTSGLNCCQDFFIFASRKKRFSVFSNVGMHGHLRGPISTVRTRSEEMEAIKKTNTPSHFSARAML